MKVYRIDISAWTSSFRYPNIISGYQPTLKVPPISTILGLLNACAGTYLKHKILSLGYCFKYAASSIDLETIYQFEVGEKGTPKNKTKSNVVRREFLYDCKLCIYLTDSNLVSFFKKPVYQILLGRSNDIASIDSIKELNLEEVENACKIKGQVIQFSESNIPGTIQALPIYFTDTIPRSNIGTQPCSVIPFDSPDYPTKLVAVRDIIDDEEIDIYLHKLNFI